MWVGGVRAGGDRVKLPFLVSQEFKMIPTSIPGAGVEEESKGLVALYRGSSGLQTQTEKQHL